MTQVKRDGRNKIEACYRERKIWRGKKTEIYGEKRRILKKNWKII